MQLEDHLGDIIRKGRLMAGVSAAAAARAANLTETELAALEESGQWSGPPLPWDALAPLIGLDAMKLKNIAAGWQPAASDLARWRELRQFTTSDGGMAVNCFLIWDVETRAAALFDTGWSAAEVLTTIAKNQLALCHLFITHTHQDHIAAVAEVRRAFPEVTLHNDAKNPLAPADATASAGVSLGHLRITHRATPGHAPDGVTYLIHNWPEDAPLVAIVGDAIFAGSMGRGNQSWALAREKVRTQILTLPEETLLCPGHGPVTTVAEERAHNPFF